MGLVPLLFGGRRGLSLGAGIAQEIKDLVVVELKEREGEGEGRVDRGVLEAGKEVRGHGLHDIGHGVGLSRPRLAVGQDGCVVPVEQILCQRRERRVELVLRRLGPVHRVHQQRFGGLFRVGLHGDFGRRVHLDCRSGGA